MRKSCFLRFFWLCFPLLFLSKWSSTSSPCLYPARFDSAQRGPYSEGNLGCLASDIYRDHASHPSQSPPGALSIYTDRFSFNLFFSNCPAMLSSEGPSAIWWILLCWGHWPLSSFPLFQPHRSWFRLDLVALVTCPLDWILETLGIFVP